MTKTSVLIRRSIAAFAALAATKLALILIGLDRFVGTLATRLHADSYQSLFFFASVIALFAYLNATKTKQQWFVELGAGVALSALLGTICLSLALLISQGHESLVRGFYDSGWWMIAYLIGLPLAGFFCWVYGCIGYPLGRFFDKNLATFIGSSSPSIGQDA